MMQPLQPLQPLHPLGLAALAPLGWTAFCSPCSLLQPLQPLQPLHLQRAARVDSHKVARGCSPWDLQPFTALATLCTPCTPLPLNTPPAIKSVGQGGEATLGHPPHQHCPDLHSEGYCMVPATTFVIPCSILFDLCKVSSAFLTHSGNFLALNLPGITKPDTHTPWVDGE